MSENNILTDSNGKKSSKRIAGFVLLGVAVVMGITLFSFSIAKPIGDPSTALSVVEWFILGGGALLGTGVFEGLRLKK